MTKTPSFLLAGALLCAPALAQTGPHAWPEPADVTRTIGELSAHEGVERIWLGTTGAGHDLEALRFGPDGRASNHPAILVVGNVTGDRLAGTAVALGIAAELASGSDAATALLDAATVYVIPSANPDAAALRFATPLEHTVETGDDRDTDRDGLSGEDGPADVNGDGLVTWMRVPDPAGTYIADPHDPRLNVEADATRGERGMWRLVREGFDADGDGTIAEDRARDAQVNKNFPAGYTAHTAAGGIYGGSERTTRALMDFALLHPELALVLTLDAQDTLVSTPKPGQGSSGRVPTGKVMSGDAKLLEALGRHFGEHVENAPKADSLVAGSFQRWLYEQRGVLTLDSALWDLPKGAPEPDEEEAEEVLEEASEKVMDELAELGYVEFEKAEVDMLGELGYVDDTADEEMVVEEVEADKPWRKPGDAHEQLEWVDASGESWRFVDWQSFDHPTLGLVEIGGWAPYAEVEPPADALPGLIEGHFAFLASLGELLPRVEIASFEATHLGKDLWRIEARIENPALLPVVTDAASRARTSTRARVDLYLPEGASLIVGHPVGFVNRLNGLGRTGSDGELEWLVTTTDIDAVRLGVTTRNAGAAEAAITRTEDR